MAVNPPARIAILGAGPIGLEALLYARFLGYEAVAFEQHHVGANLRRWGHVRMFSPFGMNCSALGVAALQAQDPSWEHPGDDTLITGSELVDRYLIPLSQTDLVADRLRESTEVVAVGRTGLLKGDSIGDAARGDAPFRLLTRTSQGEESFESAEVVLDCTGTFPHTNWMGQGGIPALGELASRHQIEYGLPNLLGAEGESYRGRHILVVGAGYSAATNVVALSELAAVDPSTRITWLTRGSRSEPIARFEQDPLPERDRLAQQANELARRADTCVTYLTETTVHRIRSVTTREGSVSAGRFDSPDAKENEPPVSRIGTDVPWAVELVGRHVGAIEVDRILANVGYQPDYGPVRELQLATCYATEGPLKLAAALLGETAASSDCLEQSSLGPESLVNPEPNFYVLGAKSYGRMSQFLLAVGHEQIRDVFRSIADSPDLDLNRTVGTLDESTKHPNPDASP